MDKEDIVYVHTYSMYIYYTTYSICTHVHTHTHNGVLLSHKKIEMMPFAATWMDIEVIILSEAS